MTNSPEPRVRRSRSRSERWATRLGRWPLLRLMLISPAFRLVVIGGFIAVAAGVLLVFRWWTITPPEMKPAIRISTLDMIQNWSLKRKARQAEALGDFEAARSAWRAACAQKATDLEAIEGGLKVIPRLAKPAEAATMALNLGAWMVRLGRTNTADLELVSATWLACDLNDRVVTLLARADLAGSEVLARRYALALFRAGRTAEFVRFLRQRPELVALAQQALAVTDPTAGKTRDEQEFLAMTLAYLGGWGPSGDRNRALSLLKEIRRRDGADEAIFEAEMAVHVQNRDLVGYADCYKALEESGRIGLRQQAVYWTLLAVEGRKDEAVKLYREANPVPKTDADVLRLVTVLARLEQYEDAEQLCRRYLDEPPWLQEGALLRGDLLIRLKRWDDLRQLAVKIRTFPALMETLGGFSYFLEGVAEFNLGYRDLAIVAFDNAIKLGLRDPRIAVRVADTLLDTLKLPGHAESVLLALRSDKTVADDPTFLTLLVKSAYLNKHTEYLWDAVSKLYKLTPTQPADTHAVVRNNYAATLLLMRTNAAEAITHTLALRQIFPRSIEAQLNHILALMLNGRVDEADELMRSINPDTLTTEIMAQYRLTRFELLLRQRKAAEARAELRQIQTSELFPVQVQWLESATRELDAMGSPGGASGTAPQN